MLINEQELSDNVQFMSNFEFFTIDLNLMVINNVIVIYFCSVKIYLYENNHSKN